MKKLTLTLLFLAFPLTAMAQDKPVTMSQSTVDAAVKRFEPTFCHKPIKKQMEAVYECYQNIKVKDPQYEVCNLGDRLLMSEVNVHKKKAKALGDPDPFPNIPPFFEQSTKDQRTLDLMSLLGSKGYTIPERVNYLRQAFTKFNAKITQLCSE